MINKLNLIKTSVYESNAERGFWEDGLNKNKGEAVMLMITELSEAVEAHRKDKRYNRVYNIVSYNVSNDSIFYSVFEGHCKDTLEDEIADTVIRILDYCGGFNIELIERDYRGASSGNFSHDVLELCNLIIRASKPVYITDWGYVLAAIIKFCEWYNIDFMQHIEWKLRYNSSRPYKHGKRY